MCEVLEDLQVGASAEEENMKLISLTGFCGVGKDLAATGLEGWTRVSFAQPIRDQLLTLNPLVSAGLRLKEAIELFGWDGAKHSLKEVRRLMQVYGTEVGRQMVDENVWVDMAEQKIIEAKNDCVITDLRFPNEAKMVRSRGGMIIRIVRTGIGPTNDHSSEHQEIRADVVIENDGSTEELHRRIREAADLIPDRCPEFVG